MGSATRELKYRLAPGQLVSVARPEKVLYPAGFTKADLVKYYLGISRFILPHLKNRPVTLKRYPNGVHGEALWEKDAPAFAPNWIRTIPVPRRMESGDINYIVVNDTRTLAWCASVATIEFHPFLHNTSALDQPTSVVFDLDPGEGADILLCAEVAFRLKEVFDKLKLKSFAKVSGSKGIQLHVPLNTECSYEVTRRFARAIAELMERTHPQTAVADMSKSLRRGKVFIDWSQNMSTKTTVGVYSLRAKPGRPFVSMPVTWEELRMAVKKADSERLYFESEAAVKRFGKVGDLYQPVLKLKQHLPEQFIAQIPPGPLPRSKRLRAPKSLETYEAKRDFSRSREPAPTTPRRSMQGGKRRFVVQKHAASHLHYDLRLEMKDTLKSWSVPKGLPLEPGESRTAIGVEDHPINYLQFEGTIPQGQYGGGTVMVWDIGTYELLEGNYYSGRLHLHFNGKKLKGEWLLERRGERDSPKPIWSVRRIKGTAKPGRALLDRSVLTGRSMSEIAADADPVWQSNRHVAPDTPPAPKRERPLDKAHFIPPMLAKLSRKVPEGIEWRYELKWDGYRVEAIKHGDSVRLFSRRANDLTKRFPQITAAVKQISARTAILDGEVVAVDENGRPSFQTLQNRSSLPSGWSIVYYAFDLLHLDGEDLTRLPLVERRRRLRSILEESGVLFSADLPGDAPTVVEAVRRHDLEGVVAKRSDSIYESGQRSGAWVKTALKPNQEFVIGGYRPAANSFQLLLVGYYEKDELIFAGKVRQGLNSWNRGTLFQQLKKRVVQKCPFVNLPNSKSDHFGESVTADEMGDYIWVRPQLVAQVRFTEWTRGQVLRHAEFAGLREDKEPREVGREA
jgi:bifunctional non-homologous end joining protein LigD